jgi:prepilin-type N-terminal cleavage/methylation domain-containing protein
MKKKAFTLIEILIVLFIVGMLIGIMFKVYTTVAQIAFRVEQQKNVNQELLFMSEILQNFSNRNKIDYSKYGDDRSVDSRNNLVVNNGYTNVLYMT